MKNKTVEQLIKIIDNRNKLINDIIAYLNAANINLVTQWIENRRKEDEKTENDDKNK